MAHYTVLGRLRRFKLPNFPGEMSLISPSGSLRSNQMLFKGAGSQDLGWKMKEGEIMSLVDKTGAGQKHVKKYLEVVAFRERIENDQDFMR